MKIKLFESNGLNRNSDLSHLSNLNLDTIISSLSSMTLSFSVEESSRAFTHFFCEADDSFTQQSQRYVIMSEGGYVIPRIINEQLKQEFINTTNELFALYNELSTRKPEFEVKKGRATKDWFKYGIPQEDARYILPICTKTNIFTSMSGDKLINCIRNLPNDDESIEFVSELGKYLPSDLTNILEKELGKIDKNAVYLANKDTFDLITDNAKVLWHTKDPFARSGLGALTSTSQDAPSKILESYGSDVISKLEEVTKRVLGYNHNSIIEHARFTLGLIISLTTYHQYERHRLPSNIRESFESIPLDREIIVPPSVKENNEAYEKFMKGYESSLKLREKLMSEKQYLGKYALVNGSPIKVISNLNAPMQYHIGEERLCNNAQWEIQRLEEKIALLLREIAPDLFYKLSPKCVINDHCPEGRLSCGRRNEMIEKYS